MALTVTLALAWVPALLHVLDVLLHAAPFGPEPTLALIVVIGASVLLVVSARHARAHRASLLEAARGPSAAGGRDGARFE